MSSFIGIDYDNWRIAAVLSKSAGAARIGFSNGDTGTLPASAATMGYRRTGGGSGPDWSSRKSPSPSSSPCAPGS